MDYYNQQKEILYQEYFKITGDEKYSAILVKIHLSKYTGYPSIQKIKNYFDTLRKRNFLFTAKHETK